MKEEPYKRFLLAEEDIEMVILPEEDNAQYQRNYSEEWRISHL